jgi:hypothetical protein
MARPDRASWDPPPEDLPDVTADDLPAPRSLVPALEDLVIGTTVASDD